MQFMAVTATEVPLAAKVFTAVCGLGFLAAGLFFVFRNQQVAEFGRELVAKAGQEPKVLPKRGQVRAFGVIFLVVGALLASFAVSLMEA